MHSSLLDDLRRRDVKPPTSDELSGFVLVGVLGVLASEIALVRLMSLMSVQRR